MRFYETARRVVELKHVGIFQSYLSEDPSAVNGGSHSPVGGGEVPVPQENFPEWRCSLAQLGSTIRGGAFDDSTQARNSHGISSGTIQIRNNSVVTGPSELWGRVITTINTTEQVTILASILANQEGRWFVSNLARKEAELCIEILAQGIAENNLKTTEKQAFLLALRRLAGIHGRLPYSMMITEEIEIPSTIHASGGFADVRIGNYMGRVVALKVLRADAAPDNSKIRKKFCKEVILWNTLSHPNVLELAGVLGDMNKQQFVTVSEWVERGNIMEYIRKNSVNRLELLHGAAQGLRYLHHAGLVHGDLKGANILISNDTPPRACLADFGFMTTTIDRATSCSARVGGGTAIFMSPEMLLPMKYGLKHSIPTPESDIYAFGLVTWQVLTGEIPFRGLRIGEIAMWVVEGNRPPKPENALAIGFSDSLWSFVQRCWDDKAELRPQVAEVVSRLERAASDGTVSCNLALKSGMFIPPHVVRGKVCVVNHEEFGFETEEGLPDSVRSPCGYWYM